MRNLDLTDADIRKWENLFKVKIRTSFMGKDPSHDFAHFSRVAKLAVKLALESEALLAVVLPAAWLHDLVNVPKNDPRRAQASKLSAQEAILYLRSVSYPSEYFEQISHAIEAHSFSAGIMPETLEAKTVQDADRLDALGAIGIARLFITGGLMDSCIYHEDDPFSKARELDDRAYMVDHFFKKLFVIVESLHTSSGKKEGEKRILFMKEFLLQLEDEITILQAAREVR